MTVIFRVRRGASARHPPGCINFLLEVGGYPAPMIVEQEQRHPVAGVADLERFNAHQRLQRAYLYWRGLQPAPALPGRQHLDPLEIVDLLPHVTMIDVQPEPFRLRYRLVGTRYVEALGREITGQWVDEAHARRNDKFLERCREVAESGVPSWRWGRPNLWENDTVAGVENLMMPLAADGISVDVLFMVSVFFQDDARARVI